MAGLSAGLAALGNRNYWHFQRTEPRLLGHPACILVTMPIELSQFLNYLIKITFMLEVKTVFYQNVAKFHKQYSTFSVRTLTNIRLHLFSVLSIRK
jgi:hypothetical protein